MLLFPGWTGEYGSIGHFARRAAIWPPLNLAYMAALAEKEGHEVKIIDAEAEKISFKDTVAQAIAYDPDIIGTTATTPFFHIVKNLSEELKLRMPHKPIVIGGHHITVLKEKAFYPCFDYAFIGESEVSWVGFLRSLSNSKAFTTVRGLLYRNGEETKFTGNAERMRDIDSIPFPARHLLKSHLYKLGTSQGKKQFTSIMTMRGCPFRCIFCSTDVFGREVRKRSPRLVVEEIKHVIAKSETRHFMFLDDTLTLDRSHTLEICDCIKKEKLKITFEGSTRANLVDEELIARMVDVGLIRLSFGLETVDEGIREIIKKEVPLKSYMKANQLTNKYGIETLNSCMIGLPGETTQTIEKTLNFLRHAREIKQANLSIAVPYPGTELYEMAKRGDYNLRLMTEDFSKYRRYNVAVMQVGDLSPADLIKSQNQAYLEIYSAPWRIMPMIRKSGVLGGILTFLRILKTIISKIKHS